MRKLESHTLKRRGGDDSRCSKKSRGVAKAGFIYLRTFDVPLISTTTGSPCESICLNPSRPCIIGRKNRLCEYVFEDRRVSKFHCQIFFDALHRKIFISDGGFASDCHDFSNTLVQFTELEECSNFKFRVSSNGVFVNGDRIKKGQLVDLSAGDEVLLVCGNEICSLGIRIGFLIERLVLTEEVVMGLNDTGLGRPRLSGIQALAEHSQGQESSQQGSRSTFSFRANNSMSLDDPSTSKCRGGLIGRINFLLSRCRRILHSDDPISYIRGCTYTTSSGRVNHFSPSIFDNILENLVGGEQDVRLVEQDPLFHESSHPNRNLENKSVVTLQMNSIVVHREKVQRSSLDPIVVGISCIEPILTEKVVAGASCTQPSLTTKVVAGVSCTEPALTEKAVASDVDSAPLDGCVRPDHTCQADNDGVNFENAIVNDEPKTPILISPFEENASHPDDVVQNKSCGISCSPPGKKFYLNRLNFMDRTLSADCPLTSLPELLFPIESLSRIFIATFTSDILWFLSYCDIPIHLPVTIACHNTERCWSSNPDNRTSMPYSDFPNLVVVYPPFPEDIAFGKDRTRQGIACHHPKLLVLLREDSIRVIITSANLVEKQWNSVTNTIWWQDFPRTCGPDYSALFTQISDGDQNSRSDFAAQLAGFMASLVIDVPSQSYWIAELAKYDFGGAVGHLVASIPGIHFQSTSYVSEFVPFLLANQCESRSHGTKFLGLVEASVVGLSHLFHSAADSNGTQLKKLAAFLGKCCQKTYEISEIVLRRNTNIPADLNAVSVLVPNPDGFSDEDCIQLGFLPRNIAKWVSPLWDSGFFRFAGYIFPKEALASALEENNKKVQLILYVSQGPRFSDTSKMVDPEHVSALSSLIASVQRRLGLSRLEEVLGRHKWPELLETDFVYGASSIGTSVNAKFVAAFSAASGKRSLQFSESEESDPEWGCWTTSQESRNPSIKIIFPTIERVKNSSCGIWPSRRLLCFPERTWQRMRNVKIFHDAIPHPHDRVGHPMHVKVARRRFQSKKDGTSFGWVYCGSHNFSAAAWGRAISNPLSTNPNGIRKIDSSLGSTLHICNYELGIVFICPPPDITGCKYTNLDDIILPFVVPAPKYEQRDKPATPRAMKEALDEVTEQERELIVEAEEMIEEEEIPEEVEEEVKASDYVIEKEEEKAYAEVLWSQVDSSQSVTILD